jgi:hypothetical protein
MLDMGISDEQIEYGRGRCYINKDREIFHRLEEVWQSFMVLKG